MGPGYGPRHAWVHHEKSMLYVLNQLKPIISVYKIIEWSGDLVLQSEAMIRNPGDDLSEAIDAAKKAGGLKIGQHESRIAMTPDNTRLFVSSRGVGAIIGFKVDPATGAYLTDRQVL